MLEDDVIYAATSVDRILLYVKVDGSLWRFDFSTFQNVEYGIIIEERSGKITTDTPREKVMERVYECLKGWSHEK
jgi:hypothetical protein